MLTNSPMKTPKTFFFIVWLLFAINGVVAQNGSFIQKQLPCQVSHEPRFTVTATVQDDDTWCKVEWPDPVGYYPELWYDDGEADDYFLFMNPGGMNALKFITYFDNFIVTGGRIFVGDGSFPGPFLGTTFRVLVYDDDGSDGFPGTVIDSTDIMVENYGWVEFEGLTAQFAESNFYLAMKQLAPSPDAAPIGVDTDNPTYFRSYSNFSGTWVLCPLQDLMIRATVMAYNVPVREVDSFEVARFSGFEMNEPPLQGDTLILDTILPSEYNDYAWDSLDDGLFAYGVRTHFTNGQWSDYDVSNIVIHRYYLYMPSCFYQSDDMMLTACLPLDSNGNIPFNLLGLMLYRDMDFVEYISCAPEPPADTIEIAISDDTPPGIYTFQLTAVYDLSSYGFPGETGESGYLATEAVVSNCNPPTELEANYDQGLGAMALGWSAPIGVFQDQFDTFAVYRSDNGSPYYLRAYTGQLFFLDNYAICENENDYHRYRISALYTNGTDTCESEFSNEDGDLCLGIEHRFNNSFLSIYPNPASEVLYIESPGKIESVRIFDGRGITIEQSSNRTGEQTNGRTGEQARDHVLKIPLNGLAPGLYLVRVETGGGMVARKVVVR